MAPKWVEGLLALAFPTSRKIDTKTIPPDVKLLIRPMAAENFLWG